MDAVGCNFNRYACGLDTIQSDTPPGSLQIKEKSYSKLLNRCPFIRHANLNCETLVGKTIATLLVRHTYCCSSETSWLCRCSCSKYVYWPSVTSTKTAAVQTCLLVECYCKMGACWTIATQSVWLPIFYHSILHACWCCASLSAIPTFMVFHYQLCLLV